MKSKVSLSETNASVVASDGNILTPPLLPSPADDGCCFSCASIKQTILNMSVLAFII